jgi:hypothetical protein
METAGRKAGAASRQDKCHAMSPPMQRDRVAAGAAIRAEKARAGPCLILPPVFLARFRAGFAFAPFVSMTIGSGPGAPQSNGLPAPPRLRLAELPVSLRCFAPLMPGLIAPVILKRKQKEKTNGTH